MPPTKSNLSFSDETNQENLLNTNGKDNSAPPALTPPAVIPAGDRVSDQDPVRRSYSVSLHSINRSSAWRNAAWQTHAVVNAGAAALGSWLLTLRGGIFHQDAANPQEMVVQALGWLSVESRQGAPSEAIVSYEADADTGIVTRWHTLDVLRSILSKRGLPQNEIEKWVHACTPALTADIRADAVWVNRSDCFDAVRERWRQMRRGGMPHQGADSAEKRISLVEGWLNVESREHVPARYIAAEAEKSGAVAALRAVLVKKGLTADEVNLWLKDCEPALHALEVRLLPGQVVANHSDWFEDLFSQQLAAAKTKDPDVDADTLRASLLSEEMGPEDIWDVLGRFFKDEKTYFLMDGLAGGETETGKPSRSRRAKRAKPEASAEQTLIAAARSLLSERYGRGKGRDNSRLRGAYDQIRAWAQDATPGGSGEKAIAQIAERTAQYGVEGNNLQALLAALNDSGPSAVKPLLKELAETPSISVEQLERLRKATEKRVFKLDKKLAQIPKGARPLTAMMLVDLEAQTGMEFYPEAKVALADELAVMFDFAARRVSMVHTNIKKREAERFELVEKANRVDELPPAARSFLDSYCRERSIATLSVYGYRIRPRAIAGWQEILKSWQTNNCSTAEARKVEVRKLQDRGKSKFDPALMEALAEEEALSVWVRDGSLAPDILKTYVAASEAKEKFKEMKVPAFRHFDPYYHPCFCDFGTGRWKITFSILQPPKKRHQNADPLGVSIAFRDGEGVTINHDLKFRGKRFENDLGIDSKSHERPEVVKEAKTASKLSRFGRSAAGSKGPLSVSGIWKKATWGARLEAPRQQLAELGLIAENTTLSAEHREELLAERLEHINWHLSISPELQPVGAYPEYAREHGLVPNPEVYPHADVNSERGHLAQLRLSRLPGLRVLSVDLGVSYSAACTVLEAVTRERLLELCKNAGINSPDADSLEIRVPREGGGKSLFRRIGPDILPDGTLHPAPWALVERQFRIKLDGEKGDTRVASSREKELVDGIRQQLNYNGPATSRKEITALLADALRITRLAMDEQALRATTAYSLIEKTSTLPSGEVVSLTADKCRERLIRGLSQWHRLANGERWEDLEARELWNSEIQPLLKGDPPSSPRNGGASARRKYKEEMINYLEPAADRLLADEEKAMDLHVLLSRNWAKRDEVIRNSLADLRDLLLPKASAKQSGEVWNMGGLSFDRLTNMSQFYSLHKKYLNRPEPQDPRKNIPERGSNLGEELGSRARKMFEELRRNRAKQIASRIIEAGLGLGNADQSYSWKNSSERTTSRDLARARTALDAPCHVIAIENLRNYKPDEIRLRAENRRLAMWSAARIREHLSFGCELHGMQLREVSARYTSRQNSLSGAGGLSCTDIPVSLFVKKDGPYWKQIIRAQEAVKKGKADPQEMLIADLYAQWNEDTRTWHSGDIEWHRSRRGLWRKVGEAGSTGAQPPDVRIPVKGGALFVSTDFSNTPARAQSVAYNSSANIGLRVLTDPDWEGRYWYVPCLQEGYSPLAEGVAGSPLFKDIASLKVGQTAVAADDDRWEEEKDMEEASDVDASDSGADAFDKKVPAAKVVNLWVNAVKSAYF